MEKVLHPGHDKEESEATGDDNKVGSSSPHKESGMREVKDYIHEDQKQEKESGAYGGMM